MACRFETAALQLAISVMPAPIVIQWDITISVMTCSHYVVRYGGVASFKRQVNAHRVTAACNAEALRFVCVIEEVPPIDSSHEAALVLISSTHHLLSLPSHLTAIITLPWAVASDHNEL